jgi:hypothetical protein
MANEISITTLMSVSNNKVFHQWRFTNLFFNQNNSGFDANIWSVTTAAVDLAPTNITTKGYVAFRNTDNTNYVEIGYNDGGTFRDLIRLNPGEVALFRVISTRTIRGQANTATVKVEYTVFED